MIFFWALHSHLLHRSLSTEILHVKITIDLICDEQENFLDRLVAQFPGHLLVSSILAKLHPDHNVEPCQVVPSSRTPLIFLTHKTLSPQLCSQSVKDLEIDNNHSAQTEGPGGRPKWPKAFLVRHLQRKFYHKLQV